MGYRDDHEALLHRVDSLERELAEARREGGATRDELERVRAERAGGRAPAPQPATMTAVATTTAVVPVGRGRRGWTPLVAAGVVALGWTAVALAVGAAAWMLPAVVVSAAGAARLARRVPSLSLASPLPRSWPTLPIDEDAYRELLALERRTVVVRVAVAFVRAPTRGERVRIKQKLRGLGPITWDQGMLTIASGTLRTGKTAADADVRWTFDPEVIHAYCAGVFDRLVAVHEQHPIANIWPRARSR